ncbi:hypothetical protein BDQ17DRAFT_1334566 [Cyathus striatus]|nr:hypothetical protein BDQ17DRAFT_1334566 [Cyathus striatus]
MTWGLHTIIVLQLESGLLQTLLARFRVEIVDGELGAKKGSSNDSISEMLGVGLWLGKRKDSLGVSQLPREKEEEEEEEEAEAETSSLNTLTVASSPHDHPPIPIEELPVSGGGDIEMDELDIRLMHSMHGLGEERPIFACTRRAFSSFVYCFVADSYPPLSRPIPSLPMVDGGEIVGAHEGQDECPPSPDIVIRSPSPHGPLASAPPILSWKSSDMPREAPSLSLSIQPSSPCAPIRYATRASAPEVKLNLKDFALQKKKKRE